ncbi:hypothetical protein [Pseudomonas sp. UBA2684]|uniref:hypothetical protein n=1 Tax=Pseudomonas sp. UBA2684 TaxID=1947311 RepID=UPI000E869A88|nr:hypothetical protein [Pseudomonas sp. UBA2684]HBX54497.1 hypothetical protein [Pseudomonas sp.]|tara:strand:- start:5057 stop:5377 length:321 start_codon:yes stop_codon:yes gene_type:complete
MKRLLPLALLAGLLTLAGCAVQSSAPISQLPVSKSHPRFAPPPGADSHWDGGLGVYVVDGSRDLYYRERTYYRWSGGWSWATNPQGPWQPTDSSGVPPGLYRRYAP